MDPDFAKDEELQYRQGAALFPVGQALRATYDAENHDSLDGATTGLMIDLSKVPFEPCAKAPAVDPGEALTVSRVRPSLLTRVRGLLHR